MGRQRVARLFEGKKVVIVYDADSAGVKGATKVASNIISYATEVRIVKLKGPEGFDFTDYIKEGNSKDDFKELIKKTEPFKAQEKLEDDSPYTEVHLSQASLAKFFDKRIKVKAHVAGKGLAPFIIPEKIRFVCDPGVGSRCKICPVCLASGEFEYQFPNEDIDLVRFVGISNDVQENIIRKRVGISTGCRDVTSEIVKPINLEQIRIIPEIDFSDDDIEHVSREAYFLGHGLKTNLVYEFKGKTLPHPSTQQAIHFFREAKPTADSLSKWEITDEIKEQLKIFQPETTIDAKLKDIYEELENITGIRERHELFFVIDLVYHSVLRFDFQGRRIKGWCEALILGDTRQGKSEAAKGILTHYRAGEMIAGESLSIAGLVGGRKGVASIAGFTQNPIVQGLGRGSLGLAKAGTTNLLTNLLENQRKQKINHQNRDGNLG